MVRPRVDADLPPCRRMLEAVHEADGYPVNMPEDPVAFLTVAGALGAWVAEHDDGIVGHVLLRRATSAPVMALASAASARAAEELAVVARLLVAPWARRRGIGGLLLARAAAEAVALGRQPVLDVVKGSEAAIALYERSGWHRAGEVRVTFAGRQFDELVYLAPDGTVAA